MERLPRVPFKPTHRKVRRRTRSEWEALIRTWERSGLSQAAFCREQDLHPVQFSLWKGKILSSRPERNQAAVPSSPSSLSLPSLLDHFVPLNLPHTSPAPWACEWVFPNGTLVRLRELPDEKIFRTLAGGTKEG